MRFEFAKQWKGETFVYSSENEVLYIRRDGHVDQCAMTQQQAIRLLADIIAGDVKPLERYFDSVVHGTDRPGGVI